MTLTADEVESGWVSHECPDHGFLVATTPKAVVNCRCGKVARIVRNGRVVDETTLRPTAAKATELNATGRAFLYACGDCATDFGGQVILKRHRVGRGSNKRCLTPAEMAVKGWQLNDRGRWSLPAPSAFAKDRPLTVQGAPRARSAANPPGGESLPVSTAGGAS